jgi:hypothetical protein
MGVGAAWLYHSSKKPGKASEPSNATVKGQTYMAVYELPAGVSLNEETQDKLVSILPPGSNVTQDGSRLVITMTAVSNQQIGDIPTPLGVIKLVTLKRVSDVVSGSRPVERLPTTFSSWRTDPKIGYVWNGWTPAKSMALSEVNSAIARMPVGHRFLEAWRWNGKTWIRIY